VRFEGTIEAVDEDTADAYFATRPRGAQVAAHASRQSVVVGSREELEHRFDELSREFGDQEVPRPEWWGGWRLVPEVVEFWQGRPDRFHDRIRYMRDDGGWRVDRLAP
jgi:pyridoxamine 5'-phosphate oxidase